MDEVKNRIQKARELLKPNQTTTKIKASSLLEQAAAKPLIAERFAEQLLRSKLPLDTEKKVEDCGSADVKARIQELEHSSTNPDTQTIPAIHIQLIEHSSTLALDQVEEVTIIFIFCFNHYYKYAEAASIFYIYIRLAVREIQ